MKLAVALLASTLAAVVACSGKSTRGDANPSPSANEAGVGGEGQGGVATATGGGGGAASDPGSESVAGGPDGGGAGGEAPSDVAVTECEEERDCTNESRCVGIGEVAQRACLPPCAANDQCAEPSQCVTLDGRALGCVPRCEWPWDCEFAFDCLKNHGTGDYVCVPAQWSPFILNQ